MKMYGLNIWTEGGEHCEPAPYVAASKEKLMEKYNDVLKEQYKEYLDCDPDETLKEYRKWHYLADESDIVEMEVIE